MQYVCIRQAKRLKKGINIHDQLFTIHTPSDKAYLSYFDFKTLTCLFCTLAVVCALNWGLFGFFGFNLVSFVFAGARSMGAILVYTLIALAAIWLIVSPLITRGRLVMGDE